MCSSARDCTIKLWDFAEGSYRGSLLGHKAPVCSLCLVVRAEVLVSGSDDSTIKVWNLRQGTCIKTLQGNGSLAQAAQANLNISAEFVCRFQF